MGLGISDAVEISGRVVDLVKKGITMGLQEEVMNLREAVLNGREENLKLRQENHALNEILASLESTRVKMQDYEQIRPVGGDLVYRSKNAAIQHYACPHCMEDKRISILGGRNPYNGHYTCPNCKNDFAVDKPRGPTMA